VCFDRQSPHSFALEPGAFAMAKMSELKKQFPEQFKPLPVALMDQAKSFYMAVGQGISHWAHMEERLIQVVAKLLRASEAKAGLIMYSITNFHVWIQIIDDLFVLDGTYPKSLKLWRGIADSLKSENDIRVRLAHHSMSQEDEDPEEEERTIQAFLRPGRFDTRTKSKKFKPLTMVEIVDFTGRIGDIHEKLISLLKQMKKRKSLR
jgi:hypothetical protein